MTTNVGTIAVAFSGDTSKLEAAFAKVRTSLAGASAPIEAMKRKLGESAYAMKGVEDAASGMKRGVGAAAGGMGRMTPEAERAAAKLRSLKERAGEVDDRAGKLQTAIGGLSSAFGAAGGRVGDMVGGLADIAMVTAAGGPLMAGLALVGAGVAAIGSAFEESAKKAQKAAEDMMTSATGMIDELTKANAELEKRKKASEIDAFVAGLTPEQEAVVRGAIDVSDAKAALAKFEADFGLFPSNPMSSIGGPQDMTRDPSRIPNVMVQGNLGDPQFNLYADKLQEAYRLLQVRVRREADAAGAVVGAAAAGTAAGLADAAKDAAIDAAYNSLIRRLDADRAAFEVDRDLGAVDDGGLMAGTVLTPPAMLAPFMGQVQMAGAALDELSIATETSTGEFNALEKQLREDARLRASAAMRAVTDGVAAVAAGGFSGGGAAAGGAVGSIVDAATGGATGGLGGVLGSVLGGIMGNALDKLVESLGVLTPLFDGLAVYIGALQPLLLVVKVLMGAVGMVLKIMAPSLEVFVRPFAAIALVAVRVVEALVPLFGILNVTAAAFWTFLDLITVGVKWLDDNFFRPMVSGSRALYNAFADLVNYIVGWFRMLPGMEEFGTLMTKVGTYVPPIIDTFSDELVTATEAVAGFGAEETNIPSGYRVPYYEAETPDGRGNNTDEGEDRGRGGDFVFNGPVSFLLADEHVAAAIRRESMKKVGRLRDMPRRTAPGRSN